MRISQFTAYARHTPLCLPASPPQRERSIVLRRRRRLISPLVGGMPGRAEGGVPERGVAKPIGASRVLSRVLPILALATLAACEQQSMETQPKLKTYSTAAAFPDNAAVREIPFGTVSRNEPARVAALANRPPADEALLARGQEQYAIYCTPCHGLAGHGDGIIVERGFPQPPSYMEPRLLAADPQHFVDVITRGWGVMYSYAARVEPRDRWAIAAYIRALQVSQTGAPQDLAAVPPAARDAATAASADGPRAQPPADAGAAPSGNRGGVR